MKNLFITGVSGYFGSKLVELFDQKHEVISITGIDIKAPSYTSGKLDFIQHDIRHDMYQMLLNRDIDCAIHAAFVLPPIHNKALMEDININGTKNFLDSCARSSVDQLLCCSSATAYGFYKDNPPFFTENSPLRGNDDLTYSKNKKELEFIYKEFKETHPDVCLTIIRPCFVVGPGFDNPLARHLKKKLVPLPRDTSPFQFIHEYDLVEIIYQLLSKKKEGAYNLAADGTITFDEMLRLLGNRPLKLPAFMLYPLTQLMWSLRIKFMTEFPSSSLNMTRFPWIVSNEKLKRELNYEFKYTTKEAFEDFTAHVKTSN